MPWLVIHRENRWCTYKEGSDGQPIGEARGCFDTEAEARAQQRALYVHTESSLNLVLGSLKLEADAEDPRLLRFKNAVLARVEVNGNHDEVDEQGIKELASTIAGMPISVEHDPRRKVGFFTAGNVESGALFVDGALWVEALAAQSVDGAEIETGKQRLSVEAKARTALCSKCQKVFEYAYDYCEHLLYRAKTGAVRQLKGLTATGGALTKKPAGTDTHLGMLYLVASHQESGMDNSLEGIERREDVSEADKKRAESEAEKFADPVNKKYKLDTEAQIRAAWSYIGMPKNQKKYSAGEVSAIKRRIVSAWKKKIDKAGPPSAQDNKESATMADEITEMTSAAFVEALNALSAKVESLVAAQHGDEEEDQDMEKTRKEHMESAQRVTELEAQIADIQAKLDAEKQARTESDNRATAAKLEALKFQLVGSVMEEDEFEKRKGDLLALNEAAMELIFREHRPATVAPRPKVAASQGSEKPQITLG